MSAKLVFSTDKGDQRREANTSTYTPSAGSTKMRLESKGRGGKQVTVLFNLPFSAAEAEALMKTLQTRLGVGATFKDGTLEFRGDQRAKINAYFQQQQWKLVSAGG